MEEVKVEVGVLVPSADHRTDGILVVVQFHFLSQRAFVTEQFLGLVLCDGNFRTAVNQEVGVPFQCPDVHHVQEAGIGNHQFHIAFFRLME